jgi:hypothetical protein
MPGIATDGDYCGGSIIATGYSVKINGRAAALWVIASPDMVIVHTAVQVLLLRLVLFLFRGFLPPEMVTLHPVGIVLLLHLLMRMRGKNVTSTY